MLIFYFNDARFDELIYNVNKEMQLLSVDIEYEPSSKSFSPIDVNMSRRARSDTKLESFHDKELDDDNVDKVVDD